MTETDDYICYSYISYYVTLANLTEQLKGMYPS